MRVKGVEMDQKEKFGGLDGREKERLGYIKIKLK